MLRDWLKTRLDVYSRRNEEHQGYRPDTLSERVRTRIWLLLREVFQGRHAGMGMRGEDHTAEFYEHLHLSLQHAYGRLKLSSSKAPRSPGEDLFFFTMECKASDFFDFLELIFSCNSIFHVLSDENELVSALNEIFRVEEAPYQLTPLVRHQEPGPGGGSIFRVVARPKVVRVEDEVTHTEAVLPALTVLAVPPFEAAGAEFRDALEEYRRGRYGDCLVKCASAFESTLKVLCTMNRWPYDEMVTFRPLLNTVLTNLGLEGFYADPLGLVGTMRNRLSTAHGGGTSVREVPRHVAQYALTSTAAAITLLVHEASQRP